MMTGHTLGAFVNAVLAGLDAEPSKANRRALARLALAEGAFDPSAAGRFNPINSSVPHGNSTPFNSDGVQNYRTFANGVAGTVALLQGERWRGVVAALKWAPTSDDVLDEFARVYADWGGSFQRVSWTQADAALARELPK